MLQSCMCLGRAQQAESEKIVVKSEPLYGVSFRRICGDVADSHMNWQQLGIIYIHTLGEKVGNSLLLAQFN